MRFVYFGAFLVTLLVLIYTIKKSYMSQKNTAKTLRRVLITAVVATLANIVVIVSPSETVCMLAYSVFLRGNELGYVLHDGICDGVYEQ